MRRMKCPVLLALLFLGGCGNGAEAPHSATPAAPVVGTWRFDRDASRARFHKRELANLDARASTLGADEVARRRAFISSTDPTREGDERGVLVVEAGDTARLEHLDQVAPPGTSRAKWTLSGTTFRLVPAPPPTAAGAGEPITGAFEDGEIRFPARSTEMPYEVVLRRR